MPHADAPTGALGTVRRRCPEARTTTDTVGRLLDLLARDYGLDAQHVVPTDSICSDDVNSVEYPESARAMVGRLKLGGLDGFPHAGLTGMGALAAHVRDGGAVLIHHAPHVGVSRDATLGMIRRARQHQLSGGCSRARAALTRLQAGSLVNASPSDLDYQQGTIEQIVLRDSARVLAAAEPLRAATEVMYTAITARVDLLLAGTQVPARWVVRFGAILVNGDADMGSFSAARRVVIADQQAGSERGLGPALFG